MTRERGRWFAAALALTLAFVPALAEAQGAGTVTGRVVDQASNAPIAQAQVVVVGTTLGARTNEQGEYRIVSVPAGAQQLRVLRLGFASVTRPITVVAGQTATADFSLEEQALTLEAVVTNAVTGQSQRSREVGANISDITVDELNKAPITKLADVLSGRTAGVSLQGVAGTTGTSQRIRIRGANSLSLSNEPLIYVDGVQISNSKRLGDADAFGVGGQDVSRLNDINPEDIEKIEVLKGPAASALYGTAAANGVLLITTKRGRAGATRWSAYAENGSIEDFADYPNNYLAYRIVTPGAPLFNASGSFNTAARVACRNYNAAGSAPAASACTQDSVFVFNTLQDSRTSPFVTGNREKYGLSASGGTERSSYYLSGDLMRENGVITYNDAEQYNLRANLTAALRDDLDVQVTAGYVNSGLSLPNNDNSIFSPLINGLTGGAVFFPNVNDSTRSFRNYGFNWTPEELAFLPTNIDVDRLTVGLNGTYRPLSWLTANANTGLDLTGSHTFETLQPDRLPIAASYAAGFRQSERASNYLYTSNASARASFAFLESWTSSSTVGANYQRMLFESTRCYGSGLVEGTSSCGGTSALFEIDEDFSEIITIGMFAEQQFGWNDRLFLTGSIRGDDNSAFGQDFGLIYYPAANVSWVVSEEPWFPAYSQLSNLRFRAAFGTSGLRPEFRDAVTLFNPVAVTVDGSDISGVTIRSTGNPDLEPEKTTEYEAGLDLGLYDSRVALELTYFNKLSKDALISRNLPPSLGLTASVFDNLGSIRNQGIEAQLRTAVMRTDRVGLDVTLNYTALKNEIEKLGVGVEDIIFNRGNQRHREGLPAGAFYTTPVTFADDDGDGLIARDEVTVGTEPVFVGSSLPTRTLSLAGDLTLWNIVRISTLFDYRGGNEQLNYTEYFRCTRVTSDRGCGAAYNPEADLYEQAAYVAAVIGDAAGRRSQYLFIEDADFVKWRELAVTLSVPGEWATGRWTPIGGLSLTLAGRNLHTWTDYRGLDPEINESGGNANFTQGEFNTMPPVRYFTARLNLNF